jgi:hypothetical protein
VRIISADSATAILNEKFETILQVVSVAVLVESPYCEAHVRLAEPIFWEVDENYEVIVHEAELCQRLLETVKADAVHLDLSMGGLLVEELSPFELVGSKKSPKAKSGLLKILPKLRSIAGEIRRAYGIDMLAIGKESMPVRLAELTAGSEAIVYTCQRAVEQKESLLLGLPTRCQHHIADGRVYLRSLMEAENDIQGYAADAQDLLGKVAIEEMHNPIARGFRALRITPK